MKISYLGSPDRFDLSSISLNSCLYHLERSFSLRLWGFLAVNIFPLEKCFKTKTILCQKSSQVVRTPHMFCLTLYNEILHFAPGNILEECLKHRIRIGFSASIYYLLLKKS